MSGDYISQLELGKKNASDSLMRLVDIYLTSPLYQAQAQTFSSSKPKPDVDPEERINRSTGESSGSYLPSKLKVRMIPVISYAQAGMATCFETIPEDWQEMIPSIVTDKNAFAIRLKGDSMEPKYSDGDVAILLPSIAASNGDLVVANIKESHHNGGGFAFKVLNLVGGDPRKLRLSSYNSAVYLPMDFDREDLHWIYPVHSVTKVIKR